MFFLIHQMCVILQGNSFWVGDTFRDYFLSKCAGAGCGTRYASIYFEQSDALKIAAVLILISPSGFSKWARWRTTHTPDLILRGILAFYAEVKWKTRSLDNAKNCTCNN